MSAPSPTSEVYRELELAYDHFNRELFDGRLPPCLFTLQRQANTMGYFSPERFVRRDGDERCGEIAINPEYFAVVPIIEVLATMVHEMHHMDQWHHGTPSRRGYHNRQWAAAMEASGLMPSTTGKPGGAKTGFKMNDYPIPGGKFLAACESLLTQEFRMGWLDRYPPLNALAAVGHMEALSPDAPVGSEVILHPQVGAERRPGTMTRHKFSCPDCGANAWGKPSLRIICEPCGVLLVDVLAPVKDKSANHPPVSAPAN